MPPLHKYYSFKLTPEQEDALEKLIEFINNDKKQIFILSGFAGTGKTSLVHGLYKYLEQKERNSIFMASTGRAAKILSEKTKTEASTIHRKIYSLVTDLVAQAKLNQHYQLIFELNSNQYSENTVFFVDESSMISDLANMNMNLQFGTGKLLTDFFEWLNGRKVVFIGDTAQLPPIKYLVSPALNPDYFIKHFYLQADIYSLKQVMRFDINTGIGYNTSKLKQTISSGLFPQLHIRETGFTDINVLPSVERLADLHVEIIRTRGGISNVACLCFSNKMVARMNYLIRTKLFPHKQHTLHPGEPLMIIQNNYAYGFANGDIVEVHEVSSNTENRAGITFREVTIKGFNYQGAYIEKLLIIDDLLHNNETWIGSEAEKALMRDFIIRMSKQDISPGSQIFYKTLQTDKYLNALRVKYGYAFTTHKAQGGEWQNILIVLEPVLFIQDPEFIYRWVYTAISRSTKNVYLLKNRCIY